MVAELSILHWSTFPSVCGINVPSRETQSLFFTLSVNIDLVHRSPGSRSWDKSSQMCERAVFECHYSWSRWL